MRGVFVQRPDHPFVELRRAMLDDGRRYQAPLPSQAAPAADVASLAGLARAQLDRHGAGLLRLDRCLDNDEFLAFGDLLGDPQPERSPDVQARVDDGVILNLVTELPVTADPARQPFAANSLSLHSESSGAPAAAQPRYIVLMCLTPGPDPLAAQTIVVPMDGVCQSLPERAREVLAGTRYDGADGAPAILRWDRGRPVFSVRDFQDAPLRWTSEAAGSAEDVERALVELYTAMYRGPAYGFSWRPGLLAVIDNTRHFHGRSHGPAPRGPTRRHLKRLRIAAAHQPAPSLEPA